eukprot:1342165-Amorphochlora_amoeboformis.AAC.1
MISSSFYLERSQQTEKTVATRQTEYIHDSDELTSAKAIKDHDTPNERRSSIGRESSIQHRSLEFDASEVKY